MKEMHIHTNSASVFLTGRDGQIKNYRERMFEMRDEVFIMPCF